ncbi:unnamed protein product [Ectocarpus sp. 4 AP-2014]
MGGSMRLFCHHESIQLHGSGTTLPATRLTTTNNNDRRGSRRRSSHVAANSSKPGSRCSRG